LSQLTWHQHNHPDPAYPAPDQPSYASNSRGPPHSPSIARVVLVGGKAGVAFARGQCLGANRLVCGSAEDSTSRSYRIPVRGLFYIRRIRVRRRRCLLRAEWGTRRDSRGERAWHLLRKLHQVSELFISTPSRHNMTRNRH
jgi:hypothetical protein